MQKLITIYLNDGDKETLGVREHLSNYFSDGWTIVSITPTGSAVGCGGDNPRNSQEGKVKSWLAVVIEKRTA